MKIDNIKEFNKQREQSIIEKGEYLKINIVVESGNQMPIAEVSGYNISAEDVAICISVLEDMKKELIKKCPEAGLMSMFMHSSNYKIKDNDGDEGEK